MYKFYFLAVLILVSITKLISGELYISSEYLNRHKPDYVLIHDLSGNLIHYDRIRKKDYSDTFEVNFDDSNIEIEKLILTTTVIGERDGRMAFLNRSFLGLRNGYVLSNKSTAESLREQNSPFRVMEIKNTSLFGEVERVNDFDRSEWNWNKEAPGIILDRTRFSRSQSSLVTVKSLSDVSMWYCLVSSKDIRSRDVLLNGNDFRSFNDFKEINFSREIYSLKMHIHMANRQEFLAYSPLINEDKTKTTAYIPAEILPLRHDLFLHLNDPKAGERVTYTQSYATLPDSIEIPEWKCDIDFSDREFNINTIEEQSFFSCYLIVEDSSENKNGWFFYGLADDDVSISLPDFPNEIIRKLKFPLINESKLIGGSYQISSSLEGEDLFDLPSPFEINNLPYLSGNNRLTVFKSFEKGE